jgi:hypothetical protein
MISNYKNLFAPSISLIFKQNNKITNAFSRKNKMEQVGFINKDIKDSKYLLIDTF